MTYATTTITKKYHDAIENWQKHNFPELEILTRHWDDYFRGVPEFQLLAKVGDLKTEVIEFGQYSGRKRFEQAKEMVGNAFFSARDIVRAQFWAAFDAFIPGEHLSVPALEADAAAKRALRSRRRWFWRRQAA